LTNRLCILEQWLKVGENTHAGMMEEPTCKDVPFWASMVERHSFHDKLVRSRQSFLRAWAPLLMAS
jgi:hypothetical protein